jgi:hypothetical protein
MDNKILESLKSGQGRLAWLTFIDGYQIRAGIHEIDEKTMTVKLIIGKGLRELQELQKKETRSANDERLILEDPNNFSVIPIQNFKEVILSP